MKITCGRLISQNIENAMQIESTFVKAVQRTFYGKPAERNVEIANGRWLLSSAPNEYVGCDRIRLL